MRQTKMRSRPDSQFHRGDFQSLNLEEKLMSAAETGNSALVKRLIRKGANVDYVEDRELRYTALHYAAFNGYADVVEELVQAGANVNSLTTDNYTALMLACMEGFADVVDTLFRLSRPDLSVRTKSLTGEHDGLTCLHLAVLSGNDDLLRLLIAQGAEREAVTNAGYSALHLAAESGLPQLVGSLLSLVPSLHTPIPSGLVPYRYTADGRTALHLAVVSGVRESVELLLADDHFEANLPDKDGFTPLHLAVAYQYRDVADLLLRQGVAVNTRAQDGRTPLLDAAQMGAVRLVDLLLQYSADLALADQDGVTALMIAVDSGSEKLVRALLLGLSGSSDEARRTVCNQQDDMGYTALHRAVEIAHEGIVWRLVDAGAAATIPNSAGRTAFSMAQELGSKKILSVLSRALPPLSPTAVSDEDARKAASEDALHEEEHGMQGGHPEPQCADAAAGVMGDEGSMHCSTRPASGSDSSWVHVLPGGLDKSSDAGGTAHAQILGDEPGVTADGTPFSTAAAEQQEERTSPSATAAEDASAAHGDTAHNSGSGSEDGQGDGNRYAEVHHRQDAHRTSARKQAVKRARRRELRQQRRAARAAVRRSRSASSNDEMQSEDEAAAAGVGDGSQQQSSPNAAGEGLPAAGVMEQAEAALYKLKAQYDHKLAAISARYEARIASLQAQLRNLHSASAAESSETVQGKDHGAESVNEPQYPVEDLNGSIDWDQEIVFMAPPGTRGEDRYAGLRTPSPPCRSPPTARSPKVARSPATATETPSAPHSVDCTIRRRRRSGSGARLVGGDGEVTNAGVQAGEVADGPTLPACAALGDHAQLQDPAHTHGHKLTVYDRLFLEAVSVVLLLLAVALLLFVRFRLLRVVH